jgi:pimeloyl-ACP methyl ester carboxylesterase
MTTRIFLHGLESSNQGTKSICFREKFPDMIIPNFTGDLDTRMARLNEILTGKSDMIIVGSSFGGLMASLYAFDHEELVNRLILLAPALQWIASNLNPLPKISIPVQIYHGRNDDVVPLKMVEEIAKKIFQNLTFTVLDDDHFLHIFFSKIDWDAHLS